MERPCRICSAVVFLFLRMAALAVRGILGEEAESSPHRNLPRQLQAVLPEKTSIIIVCDMAPSRDEARTPRPAVIPLSLIKPSQAHCGTTFPLLSTTRGMEVETRGDAAVTTPQAHRSPFRFARGKKLSPRGYWFSLHEAEVAGVVLNRRR